VDVKNSILLLEDETEAGDMLANYLEMHDFDVLLARDGNQAIDFINKKSDTIDLAILDIMVPKTNGFEVCGYLRDHPLLSGIPIIFLTAKDQESDEIRGLEVGADDYIAKPASLKLIEARVKTLLRRQPARSSGWLHFGDIYLDPNNFEAIAENKRLDLTHTEFRILQLLLALPNKVYTPQEILEHISDDQKFVFDRTVDVHVKNLRIKLGKAGEAIKTYRGTGYGMNRELAG